MAFRHRFRRRLAALASFACNIAAAACTFTTSTDDLVDATAVADADADAGSVPDAPPPADDRAVDTVSEGDVVASASCADGAVLCDDFDTAALGARWDAVQQTAGPLTLDIGASVSPPKSLLAVIGPSDPFTESRLVKRLPPASRIRASAQIRVDAQDLTSSVDFLALSLEPPPVGFTFFGVSLGMVKGSVQLERCEDPTDAGPSCVAKPLPIMFDRFHQVTLDWSQTSAQTILLYVDGVEFARETMSAAVGLGYEVSVGVTWTGGTSNVWRVRVDDVAVTVN